MIITGSASINQTGTIDEQFRDNSSSSERVGDGLYFTAKPLPVGVDTIMTPQNCQTNTHKKVCRNESSTSHQILTLRKAAKSYQKSSNLLEKRTADTGSRKNNIRKK